MTMGGPIFDIHHHYGIVPGRSASEDSPVQLLERDCRTRIEFMDRFGIRHAAIMPGHSYSAPRGIADLRSINDGVHALGQQAPDRFPSLFGTLDPRHGRANLAEIDRLNEMGFTGLSWHHRFQGLPIDHPVMFEILERMERYDMVAMMHCYAHGDFEAPWRLRRLAERFPATNLVGLDAMTSPENLEQFLAICESVANVFFDLTTTLLGPRGIHLAVERVGASRMLFGSNFYSMSAVEHVAALQAVEEAALGEEDEHAILFENACKLMRI